MKPAAGLRQSLSGISGWEDQLPSDVPENLGYMAAQAVRMNLDESYLQ